MYAKEICSTPLARCLRACVNEINLYIRFIKKKTALEKKKVIKIRLYFLITLHFITYNIHLEVFKVGP